MDIILEAWIGGLLSGAPTHMVNMGANSLVQIVLAGERGIAATGRSIYNLGRKTVGLDQTDGVNFDEALGFWIGQMTGFVDGMRAGAKALWTGQPSDIASKIGMISTERGGAITGENVYEAAIGLPFRLANKAASKLGAEKMMAPLNTAASKTVDILGEYYFRLPFRFLQAEDELFKVMTFQAEINAEIIREIKNRGLRGMDALDFRREALEAPDLHLPDGLIRAREASRVATFSQRPGAGAASGQLQRFINAKAVKPFARTMVPFFNVINNILRFTADRTPIKYLDFWRFSPQSVETPNIQKLIGPDLVMRDMEIAKLTSGAILMGVGHTMVWGGIDMFGLEGPEFRGPVRGPTKQKRVSRMVGRQGNSIFVPWSRMDPNNVFKGVLHDGTDRYLQSSGRSSADIAFGPHLHVCLFFWDGI